VLTAGGDDLTVTDDPFKAAMRQIAGAFAQLEKARLVAKLRGARERRRAATGRKVEGRKSHGELRPEVVELERLLRRRRPKGGRMTLREIGDELARRGFLNERGRPYLPNSIRSMLGKG
jgi:hypothetical protein